MGLSATAGAAAVTAKQYIMTRSSPLSILLVFALTSATIMQDVSAIVVVSNNPHSFSFTRRGFIPRAGGGALMPSLLIAGGGTIEQDAAHAAEDDKLIPPPQPIPMAGMGAPFRPLVIEDIEKPWKVPHLSTKLGQSRISVAQELSPLPQSLSPFADNDIYYPASFAGEWNVKATLRRKTYPYGLSFVPSRSLVDGSPRYRSENVGDSTTYRERYFFLDGGTSKVIADRRFNSISTSKAYNQLTPVEDVLWDPKKDPTQLKIQFAAGLMTQDMMPIGPRRAEVYITARKKEKEGTSIFAASERKRQVTLGAGAVVVSDTETITEYEILDDSNIRAVQRIAVYLTPNPNSREGVLWQQVGGKAIAFFDYDLELQKQAL